MSLLYGMTFAVSICSNKYIYKTEFLTDLTKNQIRIKASIFGVLYSYFLNSYIFKRIKYNWDEAIK